MIGYLKYFKTQISSGLQYKAAALAGISTQIFWGFINIMVYIAFYSSTSISEISLNELVVYQWLNQAFLALINVRVIDEEIMKSIKNGTVAYELCRPYNIYNWWYVKILAKKYASCLLRFLPVIVIAISLPGIFRLTPPISLTAFILFIITLVLGSILLTSILLIIQSIAFFTNEGKGISDIMFIICTLFAGLMLPLPLMPDIVQKIGMFLPFRLISDLPFRIYSGNVGIDMALNHMLLQIIWSIVLIAIGKIIMKVALKKVCIQGG